MALPEWIAATARVEAEGPFAAGWSAADLAGHVEDIATALSRAVAPGSAVGVYADNSPHWIAADLAAQVARVDLVPLPAFFSSEQLAHVVRASGMAAMLGSEAAPAASFELDSEAGGGLRLFRSASSPGGRHAVSQGRKITFASGTTQAPKGVILTTAQQLRTARALAAVIGPFGIRRHLSALPLPVLLENVAGVYTALMMGATCLCPTLDDLGVAGASGFDPERFLDAIAYYEPHSLILLPQMLHALVARLARRTSIDARIRSLKLVSVGGAKTPPALITAARALGLPVYEGYGLTECGSVVSLNLPAADRVGTVGKPLPGLAVRTAPDGELEVTGRAFAGYLGAPADEPHGWFGTGDLGVVDADGFISITGRKKNVLVTSFGRNISPEWPESLLLEHAPIAQAAVFGDARPYLVAVLVPASPHTEEAALEHAVREANAKLPEYARIAGWVGAREPFSAMNGLATPNGRIRREALYARYAGRLNALYEPAHRSFAANDRACRTSSMTRYS